ncbi:hypothetical protein SAMN02745824_1530 [Parasphingorhabdus marina DSM 22363]|uniref:Uncharacterized protein n=1 Tax=Parasphingorhabdus marina DSM 22363 TaxID=1123272 RepID=A0A1N6D4L9_9SPHN|nr:hypothetical protein [Parasphingorhabdus marina]SIN65647.1 hypothetical protein SAMN02745824_1530 [Parasphingorhabdus marina DSM 22363]
MVDFGHLEAIGIKLQIDRICDGERLGDHELLEIVQFFDPPLFSPEEMDVVANELDASRPRKRGRPTGNTAQRKLITDRIKYISRSDVPVEFIDFLTKRLRSGRRFPSSRHERKANGKRKTSKKQTIIKGLYRDVKKAMELGKTQIEYPEMEPFQFPEESENQSVHERALRAVNHIMRTYLDVDPPSERRMLNIISEKR